MNALCVVSESGTISEKSAMLGFPAFTIRTSIERPIAMDTGSIIVTDIDAANVIPAMRIAIERYASSEIPEALVEYRSDDTSRRVVNRIVALSQFCREWNGVQIVHD
jgi:UDP-N-acetylglucosamine 2-epimerase